MWLLSELYGVGDRSLALEEGSGPGKVGLGLVEIGFSHHWYCFPHREICLDMHQWLCACIADVYGKSGTDGDMLTDMQRCDTSSWRQGAPCRSQPQANTKAEQCDAQGDLCELLCLCSPRASICQQTTSWYATLAQDASWKSDASARGSSTQRQQRWQSYTT